jgi:hypothetical protein
MTHGPRIGLAALVALSIASAPISATAQTGTTPPTAQAGATPDDLCLRFGDEMAATVLRRQPWDLDRLVERGVPELERVLAESAVSLRFFHAVGEAFGRLEQMDEAGVEVTIARRGDQRTITCTYRAGGQFANGPGVITLRARWQDGAWRAMSLNVGTPSPSAQP